MSRYCSHKYGVVWVDLNTYTEAHTVHNLTGVPTFSYQIGNYIVTKIGAIICPESCTREIAEQIILKLKERGFDHTGSNLMLFVVSLPRAMFDDASLE